MRRLRRYPVSLPKIIKRSKFQTMANRDDDRPFAILRKPEPTKHVCAAMNLIIQIGKSADQGCVVVLEVPNDQLPRIFHDENVWSQLSHE